MFSNAKQKQTCNYFFKPRQILVYLFCCNRLVLAWAWGKRGVSEQRRPIKLFLCTLSTAKRDEIHEAKCNFKASTRNARKLSFDCIILRGL